MKFLDALVITIVIVTICCILYSVIDSLIVPGASLSPLKANNNTRSDVQKSNIQKSNVQKSRFSQNVNLIPNKRATQRHTTATSNMSTDYDYMLVGEGKMIDDTRPAAVATTELLSETAGETIGFGDEQDYEASSSEQIQSDDVDENIDDIDDIDENIDEVDENNESGNQATSSGDVDDNNKSSNQATSSGDVVDAQLGYAFFGAHTTGGGTGTFHPVDSSEALRTALEDNIPNIKIASGEYTFMSDSDRGYDAIDVKSNTTIIGENGVFINGGFSIVGVKNVIIRNLTFLSFLPYFKQQSTDKNLDTCKSYDKAGKTLKICSVDNINIDNSSRVWINKCTFEKTGDGLLDIKKGSKNITVSWCRFSHTVDGKLRSEAGDEAWEKRHNKTMLIGSDDFVGKEDLRKADRAITVTLHNNLFAGKSRNPRLRFGTVHAFNNYYFTCGLENGYGIWAAMEGIVLAEGNYFESVGDAAQTSTGGQIFGEITRDVNSQVNNNVNILDDCKGEDKFTSSSDTKEHAPYNYELMNPIKAKREVLENAGSGGSRDRSYEPPGAPVGSIQMCPKEKFSGVTSCRDIKNKKKDGKLVNYLKITQGSGRYIQTQDGAYYKCLYDESTKGFKDADQPCDKD